MKKAIIILPTYNEKENISKLIPYLQEEIFPKISNYEMGILVADDASPDGTADVVRELMKKWKNIELIIGEKQGLGAAYIRGMTYAVDQMNADVLFEMDADGQHDPKKIPEFLEKIDQGYDLVVGSRYSLGGSIPSDWGLDRKFYSVVGNWIVRVILMRFSTHEWTNGYRAIRKEVFLRIKDKLLVHNGYVFQVAFLHLALQNKFKTAEIPIHFIERQHGKSKIATGQYIKDMLTYVIIARIYELKRFIKFIFVGGTGFILQILIQEISIFSGFAMFLVPLLSGFLFLFQSSHDPIILADSIAGGLGAEAAILSNFLLNNFWTFKDTKQIKEQGSFLKRLFKFNSASMLSIFIQASSVGIAETFIGRHIYLPFVTIPTRIFILIPAIVFIVIPINYLIYNRLIWKTQYLKHAKSTEV